MLENKKVFSEFQTSLVKVKQSEENLEKILSERLKSQCFVLFSDFSDNSESFEFSIGENFEVFLAEKHFDVFGFLQQKTARVLRKRSVFAEYHSACENVRLAEEKYRISLYFLFKQAECLPFLSNDTVLGARLVPTMPGGANDIKSPSPISIETFRSNDFLADYVSFKFSRFYWFSSYYMFGEHHGCIPIWSFDQPCTRDLAYFVYGEHHACVPDLVFGVHMRGDVGLIFDFFIEFLENGRCYGHCNYFISHDNLVLHFDPCMNFKFWIFCNTNHKRPFDWYCFCSKIIIDKISLECMWSIGRPFKCLNYWKFVIL